MTSTPRRVSYSEAYETFREAQPLSLWATAFPKREAIGIGQTEHPCAPRELGKMHSRFRTLRSPLQIPGGVTLNHVYRKSHGSLLFTIYATFVIGVEAAVVPSHRRRNSHREIAV